MQPPPQRRSWLDHQRGVAVLLMIQVHVVDGWLRAAEKSGLLYDRLTYLGGFAAPTFLFVAGLSYALVDQRARGAGASRRDRMRSGLRRAAWLLAVAYLFRLGEFLLGFAFLEPGGWRNIFRVDILNVIAVCLAMVALLQSAFEGTARTVALCCCCAAIVLATPVLEGASLPESHLFDYLYGSPERANFYLFNWSGFALAGAATGELVMDRDRPLFLGAVGLVLIAAGELSSDAAGRAAAAYWRASPEWFAVRLGAVLLGTAGLQLLSSVFPKPWRGLTRLGRRSLFGYMASVELTYGLSTRPLHGRSGWLEVSAGMAAMTAATYGVAILAERLKRRSTPRPL